jgi:hypothetical protein
LTHSFRQTIDNSSRRNVWPRLLSVVQTWCSCAQCKFCEYTWNDNNADTWIQFRMTPKSSDLYIICLSHQTSSEFTTRNLTTVFALFHPTVEYTNNKGRSEISFGESFPFIHWTISPLGSLGGIWCTSICDYTLVCLLHVNTLRLFQQYYIGS